jgi:Nucleoside-diphosphate-sugar epimerases
MDDGALRASFSGCGAAVYALGLDDRQPLPRPAYATLHRDHVDVCLRVLRAARDAGVAAFVAYGSYFTSFDRMHPELGLSRDHPYIRTRREQLEAVLKEAGPGFTASVLEIPYVIGSLPKRVPPWTFLFDMLSGKGKRAFFFLRGGTAAVTTGQIAQATLGAIEGGRSGAYPLGGINLSWRELASRFLDARGMEKRLVNLPPFLFRAYGLASSLPLAISGRARGLDVASFARFQYSEAYLDPEPSMKALGYAHADYDAEFRAMVEEWAAARRN